MTILQGDIVLAASAVMNDVPEGGGAPSATLIIDGADNGIFPDISELDRTLGRVNLRKIFAEVRTLNTDGYYGVNMIVSEPPLDPNVSVTLFSTNDTFDMRTAAEARIESYLTQGPICAFYMYGNSITGQKSIAVMQRTELPLPANGDTFSLVMFEGSSSEEVQFVRVTSVSSVVRTFTDSIGDFQRMEITLTLSDPLQYDFTGLDPQRYDNTIDYTNKAKIYSTTVADAASYYGIVPLASAAVTGDVVVNGTTIFTQIVPSTRVEIPVADARMNQQATVLAPAGNGTITGTITGTLTTAQELFVGGIILPGSFSISRGGITLTDKGGALVNGGVSVGTVDYANGILAVSSNVFGTLSGSFAVSYSAAGKSSVVTDSVGIPVTEQNQRLTWLINVQPLPAKGGMTLSYRALGQWYELIDDGSGALRGSDSSFGAATVNYTTGTLSATLGALPDVDSYLIVQWGTAAATTTIAQTPPGTPSGMAARFGKRFNAGTSIAPGTMVFSWTDLNGAQTAVDVNHGLDGTVPGSTADGVINYATGDVDFRPVILPAPGSAGSLSLVSRSTETHSLTGYTDVTTAWDFTIGSAPGPGTVNLAIIVSYPLVVPPGVDQTTYQYMHVVDDGAGKLIVRSEGDWDANKGQQVGTIDYSTGACQVYKQPSSFTMQQPVYGVVIVTPAVAASGSTPAQPAITKIAQTGTQLRTLYPQVESTLGSNPLVQPNWSWWGITTNTLEAKFSGTDNGATIVIPFTFDALFMATGADTQITQFAFQGSGQHPVQYVDASSTYVMDPSPVDGSGTAIGTQSIVDNTAGVLLSSWATSCNSSPASLSGFKQPTLSDAKIFSVTFRTAVAPLFNGGFTISFVLGSDTTLTPINMTADGDGFLSGSDAAGFIDYTTGTGTIYFGTPSATPGGGLDISFLKVPHVSSIQPAGVLADLLRYNAVGYSYIPLNATLLGLDPVRLPSDGRVPIFEAGSVVVIGCSRIVGPVTVTNGQTINTGVVRLSRIRLLGSDGVLQSIGYTDDLEAGTITFTDVSTFVQPMTVEYRIEDMGLVANAQINGQLRLTQPITHDYPVPGSYVSSALLAGDLSARVSTYFDQQTWTNVFSDDLIGNSATASFNGVINPIQVTNAGALTERWAALFTATTAFEIIGEHSGVIATGNTSTDCSPVNPATSEPYFTIPSLGWGIGWVPGNVLRFNTVGCEFPIWVVRTIQQGPVTVDSDSFQMLVRGDVNKP